MSNVGTLEAISTKQINTKYGLKPKYSVKIDGEWYDAGWKKPLVTEGTTVSFAFTSGKYGKEITGILSPVVPVGTGAIKGAATVSTEKPRGKFDAAPFPVPPLDPSRSIIRQNALRHATATVHTYLEHNRAIPVSGSSAVNGITSLCDSVIIAAKRYENYISGYDDMEDAAKEIEKQDSGDIFEQLKSVVKKAKKDA